MEASSPKIIINSVTLSETRDEIDEQLSTLRREGLVGKDNPISVVVDGKTLTFALDPSLKKDFLDLCCRHGFLILSKHFPSTSTSWVGLT